LSFLQIQSGYKNILSSHVLQLALVCLYFVAMSLSSGVGTSYNNVI